MFLNKPYLTSVARLSHMDSTTARDQVLTENNHIFFAKSAYDLFLSHSYLDKALVYTIVDLFNDAGYSVFMWTGWLTSS